MRRNRNREISIQIIMAAKKTKGKGKRRPAIFRPVGKYFLLALIIIGQALLAYTVVDKNYEEIHGFFDRYRSDGFGTYQLDELIVNPAETNGHRYLLVEISLELVDKEDVELIKSNELKLKHGLIEFL